MDIQSVYVKKRLQLENTDSKVSIRATYFPTRTS